jgi:hypothetical protein
MKWNFPDRFFLIIRTDHLPWKIRPVAAKLFHAGGWMERRTYRQTDRHRQTDMTNLTVCLRYCANTPKNLFVRTSTRTAFNNISLSPCLDCYETSATPAIHMIRAINSALLKPLLEFFFILFMFISNQNQLYTIHIKFTVLWANEMLSWREGGSIQRRYPAQSIRCYFLLRTHGQILLSLLGFLTFY